MGSAPGGKLACPLPRLSGEGRRKQSPALSQACPFPAGSARKRGRARDPPWGGRRRRGLGRPSARPALLGEERRGRQGKSHPQRHIRPPCDVPAKRRPAHTGILVHRPPPGSGGWTPRRHLGEPAALGLARAFSPVAPEFAGFIGPKQMNKTADLKPEAQAGWEPLQVWRVGLVACPSTGRPPPSTVSSPKVGKKALSFRSESWHKRSE